MSGPPVALSSKNGHDRIGPSRTGRDACFQIPLPGVWQEDHGPDSCGRRSGTEMVKLVSKVAFFRSEESRLGSLTDPALPTGLEDGNPGSVARWMKRMGREMGDDMRDDFDEKADGAIGEAGQRQGGQHDGGSEDQIEGERYRVRDEV